MADRIFAGLALIISAIYAYMAFFVVKARFQYDPLGPESWPQILSVLAILCLLAILAKPDVNSLRVVRATWFRLVSMVVLLIGYAEFFERLGFVISTFIFCTIVSRMLGTDWLRAALFGVATGIFGYLLCAGLLNLNLPAGPLPKI